ncbi:MAG TPA: hypothetical protein VFH68_08765 [Polyangia bacterium]|nr:hypothetical protein [Polyangia bacterium]
MTTKTTTTVIRTKSALALALLAVLAGGCPLDDDPGFDDWCGDRLCRWQVAEGSIRKAPTWHERDLGVELVADQVVLRQIDDVDSVACLEFKVIADIDPAASVFLEMDFLSDGGAPDYRQRIPSASWRPLSFLVSAPTWYHGVTLTIRKESEGHAVLARLEMSSATGCTGAPIPLSDRPAGAWCETTPQCAAGLVCAAANVCTKTFAACATDGDCADGSGPCVAWPPTCQ